MNVFLLKKPCDDCPFTSDIGLRPGRLKEIVKDCRKKDVPFLCHKSIYESKVETEDDEEDEEENANRTKILFNQHVACRGYYNAFESSPGAVIQIAQRLGFLKEVDDPTDPHARSPKCQRGPSRSKKRRRSPTSRSGKGGSKLTKNLVTR